MLKKKNNCCEVSVAALKLTCGPLTSPALGRGIANALKCWRRLFFVHNPVPRWLSFHAYSLTLLRYNDVVALSVMSHLVCSVVKSIMSVQHIKECVVRLFARRLRTKDTDKSRTQAHCLVCHFPLFLSERCETIHSMNYYQPGQFSTLLWYKMTL